MQRSRSTLNRLIDDQAWGCLLGLLFLLIAAGTGGCRSVGADKKSSSSTIVANDRADAAGAGQTTEKKKSEKISADASLFNILFGEEYYGKPRKRPRQFLSTADSFIAKQMFQMAAVTPKKYLGVVEFFDESGENLRYLQTGIARYLTDAFKHTEQFKVISPSRITRVFQEELENSDLLLSNHTPLFDKIIAGRALEMGFNVLCLGTFIEAEIRHDVKAGKESTFILKLHYRIIALDTLSTEVMSDFLGEFETKFKLDRETLRLRDLKVSMLDENHLRAFCNDLANKIMAKFHAVEWFARVMEEGEPNEESRKTFIINTGEGSGVNIGDRLAVYRARTAPIDPSNGRYLFDKRTLVGELIITGYLDKDRCRAVASSGINIRPDDLVVLKYWQH